MARVENGNMFWSSADLDVLSDDLDRLNYLIAHIEAVAPTEFSTVYQDPNACSSLVNDMLPPPDGVVSPQSRTVRAKGKAPAKGKGRAKGKALKKARAPKRGKAPARGKKRPKS